MVLNNMVGFKVLYFFYPIGDDNFLYSFFSTIAHNLENRKWGKIFPVIMNELYNGKIENKNIDKALKELNTIKRNLKKFSPDKVVWDYHDLEKMPPWGNDIANSITDLSNYFVTSDGKDLIDVLFNALKEAKNMNTFIEVKSL